MGAHYDETKNRFNPQNRFIGDIEDGKRYPFACYTKEESDERYAPKSIEALVSALAALIETKADKTAVEAIEAQIVNILQRLEALEYKNISIQSFTASPSLIEIGSNSTINLTWSLNKAATSQTINGEPVTGTSKQFIMVSDTATYTLAVSDGSTSANKTVTVTAANQIYYGVDTDLDDVTSLQHVLSNDKTRTITVDAGPGQYIIYAYPAHLGNVEFWVENFEGGFEDPVSKFLVNSSGYLDEYKVFRSTNANLGLTTVEIKEG